MEQFSKLKVLVNWMKKINLVIFFLFFTAVYAFAYDEKAFISSSGINKISFKNDRIAQVIGTVGEYTIKSDNIRGEVYLISNLPIGESFSLTVISEKGISKELHFTVHDSKEPTSLVLSCLSKKTLKKHSIEPNLSEKVMAFLKSIANNSQKFSQAEYIPGVLPKDKIKITKLSRYFGKLTKVEKYDVEENTLTLKEISQFVGNNIAVASYKNSIYVVYDRFQ